MNETIERIQIAVEEYNQRLDSNMIDGQTRWKVFGVQRKVAQAACNYGGYIVTGTRHYCPIMSLQIDSIGHGNLIDFAGGLDKVVQGFTDQYGVFMDRKEAWIVAKEAGQIINTYQEGILYSECYI